MDVQPYEASDKRLLSQHNSRLATSISIHIHTTMSTLTRRQSPLDDTGSNPNYDNYDNYGYDPSTCYQEHTCSWWWSSVRSIPSPISLLSARSISLPSQSSLHSTTPNPHLSTKPTPPHDKLTLLKTDRLRSPLHHSLHPLLPPNSLLLRRLPARPRPPTQKPPTTLLPPLDGIETPQPPPPPTLLLQSPKPAQQQPPHVQPKPLLRQRATTPGYDWDARRHEPPAAAGL